MREVISGTEARLLAPAPQHPAIDVEAKIAALSTGFLSVKKIPAPREGMANFAARAAMRKRYAPSRETQHCPPPNPS